MNKVKEFEMRKINFKTFDFMLDKLVRFYKIIKKKIKSPEIILIVLWA